MMFELKDRFFCRKNRGCMECCSGCESNGACDICASYGEADVCMLCERNYSVEQLPLMRTVCDASNRYFNLLRPYALVDDKDIPADVQAQAAAALAEDRAATAALKKLMGVEME